MTEDHKDLHVMVRAAWKHEEYDFTPWLAENLHLLGEEIGLDLVLKGTEQPVGPYSLDILAEVSGTGYPVAIENQLEWADTHHLGQLLLYAAGHGARIGIWIATEFGYEHAQVLDWLNQWTAENIDFYGVKIEAFRDPRTSLTEPRFQKLVWPGGWDRENTPPPGREPGDEYSRFFMPLVAELRAAGFSDRPPKKRWGPGGRYFPSPINPGIWYAASLTDPTNAWVTLHIETGIKTLTKHIFDHLEAARDQIQSAIDAGSEFEWQWKRHNRWNYSSVSIRKDGPLHDPPKKEEKTRTWMLDQLTRFKEVFDPRIEALLQEAPTHKQGNVG